MGMKKSMMALILAVFAVTLSSCSVYTCPTYAKAGKQQQPSEKVKI